MDLLIVVLFLLIGEFVYGDDQGLSNVTRTRRDLPEVRDGDSCVPGQMYKNECNTCRCTNSGALMCTKMACIDINGYSDKTSVKKALRTPQSQKVKYLPTLPKGLCKPGHLYRSGCRRCFCNDKNKIICSKKKNGACIFDKSGNPSPIRSPEDVRPSFSKSIRSDIQTLQTTSEKCKPGKTYRVDCNNCICLASKDLICQHKLCISFDDMNRLEAERMSGKPCTANGQRAVCVKCSCVKGLTVCQPVPDCEPHLQTLSTGQHIKGELSSQTHEQCVPDTVYKTHCNKCYCQEDGSLRCTQRSCLNHSQIKLLKQRQDYLEKYGL